MKKIFLTLVALMAVMACRQPVHQSNQQEIYQKWLEAKLTLPNGWSLTPAGISLPLDDLPLNMIVSPSQKWLAITNNGQSTQTITLVDVATEKILDNVEIKKSWVGLAFSMDENYLFASGGNDNWIVVYKIDSGKLKEDGKIVLGEPYPTASISPGGLCVDAKADRLYVTAKDARSFFICDLKARKVITEVKLEAEPYTCALSPGSHELFISLWGAGKVVVYDLVAEKQTHEILTNSHPNDMVFTRDGRYLFVPNGNDNTVSVIETTSYKVIEQVTASLYPNAPIGSTPNAVALSPDENTLYVANADNNCLAVFDVHIKGKSRAKGFIPTGWYPTSVKTVGKKIFVTNGKGFSSKPNPKGPNPLAKKKPQQEGANPEANKDVVEYIGGLFKGTLSIIDLPDNQVLANYSRFVFLNTPYNKEKELRADGEAGNPVPRKMGDPSPIKYIFYIIKENRTYDQVLGDVKEGNGDPSLCIFPEFLTPNLHKIVKEFVLLDNFYVDAEVSADGHNWSTAAYANDYVEKNWVTSYGGRGGTYDYEGSRAIAHPKNGFIWDFCRRAGITYRSYGEFGHRGKATYPGLENHVCKNYEGWNLEFKDVDREKEWEHDFDSLLAINKVPRFNSLRLGNDHTSGSKVGAFSVKAAVADNDLAVGKFIEHLSQSSVWKESAVFIVEDDAQNGADHVDAHRSTGYVVGPFVKRHFVDHTMYSTSGMLRTMELILGLPPMSQYDAAATPLFRCFQSQAELTVFESVTANVNIDERNVASLRSQKNPVFDFSHEDAAPDIAFNEDIWRAMKGDVPMPAPRRNAFVMTVEHDSEGKDDDD